MDIGATGAETRFRRWRIGDVTITRVVETDYVDGGLELYFPAYSKEALCTHLHLDHVGWNTMLVGSRWVPTFPNARHLFGRREYDTRMEMARRDDPKLEHVFDRVFIDDSITPVVDAGLADFVSADHRICDEVRLVPTHGHTAGHVSVEISSCGERAFITGDFCHHPCQLVHPDWGIIGDFDPEAAARRRREVFGGFAGTPVLVIGTHWPEPTAGRIGREGDHFRLLR